MSPEEVAARLLEIAAEEGSLSPERLSDVARGLRERAERLLAERIEPLEAKVAEQAAELEWRTGLQRALEEELIWRREAASRLEASLVASAAELARAGKDRDAASQAHDLLLAHHRRVSLEAAKRLEAVADALPRRAAAARTELGALVAALRAEAGE